MTLINSCWPSSFSHLIILLLSTFTTITISTNQNHHLFQLQQQDISRNHKTPPVVVEKDLPTSAGDSTTTFIAGYDRRIDNKPYYNLFDFKTDVNNSLFQSHGNLTPLLQQQQHHQLRKRRDAILKNKNLATKNAKNLILNLSNANFTTLTNVNLNGDSISTLNLSQNFLSTLNVSKFSNLTALDLSYNRITDFKHVNGGHKLLETLDLSGNSLTTFNCSDCERLQILNLSRNFLTNVNIENLTNLKFLDLSANLLSAIVDSTLFRNKSNLSDVILACNRISVINKDLFFQLKNLRRLDLSYNDISNIVNDAFSDLQSLQILDLSFNRIHIASLQTIQNIAQLARLSIAGNVMLKNALRAFAVTWSIMELDYSHVGLCQVPDSLAQSVRILNLYGNFLNIIASGDFESYPFLHKLILSYNNLTSIEDDALGRLEMLTILHLDHNKLTQIPPSLPSSLIKLYMHNNAIMELHSNDLMNLINLQVLDLSHNKIIYMPQLTLPALITLSVKSCGIENAHHMFLKTCPCLRQLLIDGNLIKCAQLIEIEECYDTDNAIDDELLKTISNDDIDYKQDDLERKEIHLNSISYFPNDGGFGKCGQWNERGRKSISSTQSSSSSSSSPYSSSIQKEIVPNCWNEQKLITSFSRTNESTEQQQQQQQQTTSHFELKKKFKNNTTTTTTETTTNELNETSTAVALNDNKFLQNARITKGSVKGKNDGNLSSETMNINNVTKTEAKTTEIKTLSSAKEKSDTQVYGNKNYTKKQKQPQNQQSTTESTVEAIEMKSVTMKNSKATASEVELMKKAKLAHSVNVVKTEIKALYNNARNNITDNNNGNKNLSLVSSDAQEQKTGVLLNNIMKTKHFKSENGTLIVNSLQATSSYDNKRKNINLNGTIINRNLIENDNLNVESSGKFSLASSTHVSLTRNKINAIKDNERERSLMVKPYNNKSKSIDEVNRHPNDNNESRNGHNENVPSLTVVTQMPDGNNNSGNESIDATDHQQHIMAINHTMNGEQSGWNDIRGENISNHHGIFIVFASTVGVLFTFIVVYVYRCNFINSSRRHRRRGRNGSCENINEGRDVLNDNFNEEIHSFTIETHNQGIGSVSGNLLTATSTVNHCDLLPMDVLNSTLSQSHVDRTNISMHLW